MKPLADMEIPLVIERLLKLAVSIHNHATVNLNMWVHVHLCSLYSHVLFS